ncbi:MAG: helix-turn-helix transcriptional regulator [Clostridia bacterium]|nr:helix-turn-helix transcriptional regulator [Clostridia bacterium]
MNFDYQALGRAIKELRKSRSLTQEVLSGLAAIPRSHLSMIECASMQPTLDTLFKIAQALEIPVSELLRLQEEEVRHTGTFK